jgi:hypothetical protein
MKVKKLIELLLLEDPRADVQLVDPTNQELSYDFDYYSRVNGTSEIPVKLILLDIK